MIRPLALALSGVTILAPLAAHAQDGRVWIYNRYVEPSPLETVLDLGYGVPQSDDVQASMLCSIGANWIYALVLMAADVDGLATNADVTLEVSAPGYSGEVAARVVRHEEFIHGVDFALALDDAFWGALLGGGVMTYGVAGRPSQTLSLDGAAAPTQVFLGDCRSIIDLSPDQPAPSK